MILCNHFITTLHDVRNFIDRNLLWSLFGNPFRWIANLSRFLKCTYCFYAIRISIMWELVGKLTAGQSCDPNETFQGMKMTQRPQLREQNFLIPRIGGSKCGAGHFWSHDLLDLRIGSRQLEDQNDLKVAAAGAECFDPQQCGIKITRSTKLQKRLIFDPRLLFDMKKP